MGVGPATGALVLQRCRNRLRGQRKIFEYLSEKILNEKSNDANAEQRLQIIGSEGSWSRVKGGDGCDRVVRSEK